MLAPASSGSAAEKTTRLMLAAPATLIAMTTDLAMPCSIAT